MKKLNTIMYLVGYNAEYLKNKGWGCGYVMIPEKHPILKRMEENYIDIPSFSDQITYIERTVLNGENYITIGFDTAHLWNNPSHDFNYVLNTTIELKNIIDKY